MAPLARTLGHERGAVGRAQQRAMVTGLRRTSRLAAGRSLHLPPPQIKEANPSYQMGDIAKELGARWKTMTDKDKTKYEDMAKKDKERYEKEKAAYQAK